MPPLDARWGLSQLLEADDSVPRQESVDVQRPADQELPTEELLLPHRPLLNGASMKQLLRIAPLVDRVRDIKPLVA